MPTGLSRWDGGGGERSTDGAVLLAGYCVLLLAVLLGPASIPADGIAWIGDTAARLGVPDRLLVVTACSSSSTWA